ncbi:MAG TPA: hypothetical protein PK799_14175 [Rhodocyclaceae bacterium]|nr:hypothetical protein [Rhodocyclaceae bacterium]
MNAAPNSDAPVWRHVNFRRFWLVRIGSMGAFQMQVVATGWLIYDLTGSALDLGLVGLVQFIPRVALTLQIGVENPSESEARWLASTIRAMHLGLVRIGSSKAAGRLELLEPPTAVGPHADLFRNLLSETQNHGRPGE